MTASAQNKVYIQQHLTDEALIADGFKSYPAIKLLTMVRFLPAEEAPEVIDHEGETLTAEAGYWIAYSAGKAVKATLDEYKPRPIDPDVFAKTYLPWDEPDKTLTATQGHLLRLGCQPYYKVASIWAKRITTASWIHSMKSDDPLWVPSGEWLCLSTEGKIWSVTDGWFQAHYMIRGPFITDENTS